MRSKQIFQTNDQDMLGSKYSSSDTVLVVLYVSRVPLRSGFRSVEKLISQHVMRSPYIRIRAEQKYSSCRFLAGFLPAVTSCMLCCSYRGGGFSLALQQKVEVQMQMVHGNRFSLDFAVNIFFLHSG
jgi:hypothetical protein